MLNFFYNFDLCVSDPAWASSDPLDITCLQGFLPICSMPNAHCANQLFELWPAAMVATISEHMHLSHYAPEFPTDAQAGDTTGTVHAQLGNSTCGVNPWLMGPLDQFTPHPLLAPLRMNKESCLLARDGQLGNGSFTVLLAFPDSLPVSQPLCFPGTLFPS